jgi:hypothetical protein
MEYQQREAFARRAQISRRSMALAELCIVTVALAILIDVDGLLHFFNVIGGS